MTSSINARNVRNSPFRESEWDRRLDHLLQDLENSTSSAIEAAARSACADISPNQSQFSAQSDCKPVVIHTQQQQAAQQQQYSAQTEYKSAKACYQAVSAHQRSVSTERAEQQKKAAELQSQQGYAQLSKSRSTSSLGQSALASENMLKDLDQALKASTNYIESHRTVQLPNGTQEYHEYRSTSSSGTPRNVAGDFNLERQVSLKILYSMSYNRFQRSAQWRFAVF